MRSKLALTALCAVALATPMTSARAFDGSGCGGSQFTMCASWTLVNTAGNSWALHVDNANWAGVLSTLTQIGLGNANTSPVTIALTGSTSGWSLSGGQGNPFSGFGLINLVFDATSAQGVNGGIAPGGSLNLTFDVTGGTFAPAQIGFHSQDGPQGCSTRAVFAIQGQNPNTIVGNTCGTSTVPEPATVTLVATGIAGILAARRRRRTTDA
jgi:hypothetical protein